MASKFQNNLKYIWCKKKKKKHSSRRDNPPQTFTCTAITNAFRASRNGSAWRTLRVRTGQLVPFEAEVSQKKPCPQHTTRGPRLRPRPPRSKSSAWASCAVDARDLNSSALPSQSSQLQWEQGMRLHPRTMPTPLLSIAFVVYYSAETRVCPNLGAISL